MTAALYAAEPRRPAFLFAGFLVLAMLLLPDCCLSGRHAFGFSMAFYGPICRAAH